MPKIDKSLVILDKVATGGSSGIVKIDPRALILVTVVYLCIMLGVKPTHVDVLLWYAVYPIVCAPILGLTYTSVFLQSLVILPLVLLIGMFNPIVDKTPVATIGDISITNGWLLFAGVIIRGLLSMQALLLLIISIGFVGIIRGLRRLGLPKFLTVQLLMVFRYIRVLIEEGLTMKRARQARSYGQKKLNIRLWGVLIGQLFLRSVARAERVHKAMLARGFAGDMHLNYNRGTVWAWSSTFFVVLWVFVFLFLRIFNLSLLFV